MSWRTPQSNLTTPEYGERWGDALGDVEKYKKQGFTEEVYRDTTMQLQFMKHNQNATLHGKIQIDHDYDLDTEIRFHIHTIPMANALGNAYFTFKHHFAIAGIAVPLAASWTSDANVIAFVAADQYKHKADTLFTLTPSGSGHSSILLFELIRESTNMLDTYSTNKDHGTAAANLAALYVDVHYRRASPGSATEWV